MKFKSFIFICCLSLCSSIGAANLHLHSQANNNGNKALTKGVMWPGYCEIEIINDSFDDVRVFGVFDDGSSLRPFNVYSYDSPHYISLYYYSYCHSGMDIYIDTFRGTRVYAGYTPNNTTIRIVSLFGRQIKADVRAK